MAETQIHTGDEQLDKDLQLLFHVCETERHDAIRLALANEKLPDDQFAELVPEGLARIAISLSNPSNYQLLAADVRPEARPILEQARALVTDKLPFLAVHPGVIARWRRSAADQSANPLRDSYNVISCLSPVTHWLGSPPDLHPAVRVGLINKRRNKLLLDTTLDWDDLAFLTSGLAQILADAMEEGQELAKLKLVNVSSDAAAIANRILEVEQYITKIKSLGPLYGIEFPPSTKPPQDPAAPTP